MIFEIETILELYDMTLPNARVLEKFLQLISADAQLHSPKYEFDTDEKEDDAGNLKMTRRISIFIRAEDRTLAQAKLYGVSKSLWNYSKHEPITGYEPVADWGYNGERTTVIL